MLSVAPRGREKLATRSETCSRSFSTRIVTGRVAADEAVQQCYRVSPGPDFVLVVHTRQMPDYLALAQRLFTSDANVRNVKAYFSIRRSKFGSALPLSAPAAS